MANSARWEKLWPAFIWMLTASVASAQSQSAGAPTRVDITPRLVTSGQPSAEALAGLAAQGFEAVIYLLPPTVFDAVRDDEQDDL